MKIGKIILDQKIPEEFLKVYKFFEKPYFEESEELMNYKFDNKIIDALDILLWKWKFRFLLNCTHIYLI